MNAPTSFFKTDPSRNWPICLQLPARQVLGAEVLEEDARTGSCIPVFRVRADQDRYPCELAGHVRLLPAPVLEEENEVGVSVADREAGEFGPRGPRGSYSWYAGVLGVGGSAIVDADNGKGVEAGDITGVVKAEPAPGDFTLEGAGGS